MNFNELDITDDELSTIIFDIGHVDDMYLVASILMEKVHEKIVNLETFLDDSNSSFT